METKDWITIVIAIYAAILSTIIAFRDTFKERRQLKITLAYTDGYYSSHLIITNSGHRPISIIQVLMTMSVSDYGFMMMGKEPKLPRLLNYGETIDYEFGQPDLSAIVACLKNNKPIYISIVDGEGRYYQKYNILKQPLVTVG